MRCQFGHQGDGITTMGWEFTPKPLTTPSSKRKLSGETEAGSAGTQPRQGIAGADGAGQSASQHNKGRDRAPRGPALHVVKGPLQPKARGPCLRKSKPARPPASYLARTITITRAAKYDVGPAIGPKSPDVSLENRLDVSSARNTYDDCHVTS